MKIIESVAEFREVCKCAAKPLGLVPTMGYLHRGHLSLVKRARDENATVAVSIFVNPAQFGPNEDLLDYPRDMESDLATLGNNGVDLVFAPSANEIYPPGFDTQVDVGSIGSRLEGEHRPGHVKGVATVVCKLLAIVRPDRCYFGQKDAQQCLVIQRLNADLNLGAEIVVCPTIREPDGLALSSRNINLNPEERKASLVLYQALGKAKDMLESGEKDAEEIRGAMRRIIEHEPLAEIDYVSVADPFTLEELNEISGEALALMAVHIGKTRLIDNMMI